MYFLCSYNQILRKFPGSFTSGWAPASGQEALAPTAVPLSQASSVAHCWPNPKTSVKKTPMKISIEPKNHPIVEENHLNQTFICWFHVNFPGCSLYFTQKLWIREISGVLSDTCRTNGLYIPWCVGHWPPSWGWPYRNILHGYVLWFQKLECWHPKCIKCRHFQTVQAANNPKRTLKKKRRID